MNYYEILGVTPDSTLAEIKAAYRRLARKFHPDVNPQGTKIFKNISKAYDTLSDDKKRAQYDTINGFFKSSAKEENNNQKGVSQNPQPNKQKKKEKNITKIINDIFVMSKKSSKKTDPKPKDGEDINTDVTISLKEAVHGSTRTINVVHTQRCPRCNGRKFINGAKCSVCSGSGEYSQHKRINVKIPANVKNGAKLRIKGEGGQGEFGGQNGDLYLHIHVEGTSKIQYEDLNILYNVPITPYEAVLGGEIIIPIFDGNVKLKLPPKTSSGQKFRVAGQGLKRNGKIGDMIVTVTIEISKRLSDDEVKLYEKLKKMSGTDIRENLLNE